MLLELICELDFLYAAKINLLSFFMRYLVTDRRTDGEAFVIRFFLCFGNEVTR